MQGGDLRVVGGSEQEVVASNSTLTDKDGDTLDWVEILNTGEEAVELGGYRLAAHDSENSDWFFPAGVLEAGETLVVFASGKDRAEPGADRPEARGAARRRGRLELEYPHRWEPGRAGLVGRNRERNDGD